MKPGIFPSAGACVVVLGFAVLAALVVEGVLLAALWAAVHPH